MDELLEQLRVKIESRNAIDFLESLVTHFSGHFGSWLIQQQIAHDHECPECGADEFPDQIQ